MRETVRMSFADLSRGQAEGTHLRLASILGVSVNHEVWMLNYEERYVYIVVPESGPVEALRRWARTERDLLLWTAEDDGQYQSIIHAMRAAMDEVRAERCMA